MISFSHFHLTRNFDYESENLHEAEKGQEVSNHFLIEESGTLKIGLVVSKLERIIRTLSQKLALKLIKMSLIPSGFFGRTSNIFDPLSPDIWDPFQDLPFSSLSLSAPRSDLSTETAALANTRIDWRETPEAHIFKADLPGLRKDEVNVEIEEGNVLRISGERSDTWHRVERSSGQFLRRFRLPENARIDQVKASTEYGVLTVTVPKVIADRPDVRAIEISG